MTGTSGPPLPRGRHLRRRLAGKIPRGRHSWAAGLISRREQAPESAKKPPTEVLDLLVRLASSLDEYTRPLEVTVRLFRCRPQLVASWTSACRFDRRVRYSTLARTEIDFLTREISSAVGLGSRPRKGADAGERLRKAVTNRIRSAIAVIADNHPALGEHLTRAVRLGTVCSYAPAKTVDWET